MPPAPAPSRKIKPNRRHRRNRYRPPKVNPPTAFNIRGQSPPRPRRVGHLRHKAHPAPVVPKTVNALPANIIRRTLIPNPILPRAIPQKRRPNRNIRNHRNNALQIPRRAMPPAPAPSRKIKSNRRHRRNRYRPPKVNPPTAFNIRGQSPPRPRRVGHLRHKAHPAPVVPKTVNALPANIIRRTRRPILPRAIPQKRRPNRNIQSHRHNALQILRRAMPPAPAPSRKIKSNRRHRRNRYHPSGVNPPAARNIRAQGPPRLRRIFQKRTNTHPILPNRLAPGQQ